MSGLKGDVQIRLSVYLAGTNNDVIIGLSVRFMVKSVPLLGAQKMAEEPSTSCFGEVSANFGVSFGAGNPRLVCAFFIEALDRG